MGYSSIATSIRSKNSVVSESVSAISNISFSGNWKGSAYEGLTGKLNDLHCRTKWIHKVIIKH